LLPVVVCAQLIEIPLPAPGHLGMMSNLGASEIPLEAMRYSLNVDVFSDPGILKRRVGLQNYGGSNLHLYGAYGYYNPYDNHKLIVGVHDSTFVWFDTLGAAHSSQVGHFFVSDTFTTNPDIGVTGLVFPYRDSYHDWLPYRDLLIHCDGKSTPIVFTTSQTFHYQDRAFDTSGYEPRAISMGLEAPGQLRVGLTDMSGPLRGTYRYSYVYVDITDSSISRMALPSAVIHTEGDCPYLTQFEEYGSTSDGVHKLVLRQKMDGRKVWSVIDTIKMGDLDTTVTVVDIALHCYGKADCSRGYACSGGDVGYYRLHDNYTYKIILTTDNGTVDSAYISTGSCPNVHAQWTQELTSQLNSMSTLGDSIKAVRVGGSHITLTTIPPCYGLSWSNDTGITVTMVLDSIDFNNRSVSTIFVDNFSDSTILAWQYAAMKCSINTLTGSFDYTVSIGYNDNADTSTVSYTSDGTPTLAEIGAGLVAAINTDDSISLRVTAYDSSSFYVIKVDSLDLLLDSLCFDAKHDTVRVRNTRWDPSKIDTTMRTPGGLTPDSLTTGTVPDSLSAMSDSVYNIAYSYYDPATGFESPLGPSLHTTLADSITPTTNKVRSVTTGWPADGRPGWIRLYQGVVKNSVTGHGDTTIWYGLYQMRTRDSARTIIWGNWQDDSVSLGLDTSLITVDTIYSYNQFWTVTGDVVVQPPYHYDLQIPFSQMRYAHFRFYGIGDPLCPNCIYFTPVDTIAWQYPLDDHFEIEPGGDEFVALEELHGTLYAFKHNSIWYLAGYDAEMETMWGRVIGTTVEVRELTSALGAVSRENVVKYKDAIYFLTPQGVVMTIDGEGLRELSTPVQNWIDTLFKATKRAGASDMYADYAAFKEYAHLFCADDQLKLINDSSGKLLSYHIPSQTWGEQKYTSFIPTRMFEYDSTHGLIGTNVELYFAEGTGNFKQEYPYGYDYDQGGNFEWAAEFSMPGNGLDFFSIDRIMLRQEPRSSWMLRYTIYDSDGDNLVSDSIYQYVDHYRFLRWDLREHDLTMYPSIRLWGKVDPNYGDEPPIVFYNRFEIESIIFTIRNQGGIYAQ
jgi:hypothetical protein